MKIAINLWVLRNKNYDGIGYFAIQTTRRLIASMPNHSFLLLLPNNYNGNDFVFSNVQKVKLFPALRHPIFYIVWIEIILPIFFLFQNVDSVYAPDGFISPFTKAKQYPVIHDLNFIHYPEGLKYYNKLFYQFFIKKYCNRATSIITVSGFSKSEIEKYFNIAGGRIKVVYSAINFEDNCQIISSESLIESYFFCIGSLIPRKNLNRLVKAFELFKNNNSSNVKLKIAGNLSWDASDLSYLINQSLYRDDIEILGRVSDEDKFHLIRNSLALCFVSIYEGFGVPILEAFHAKTVLITSDVTSMPEIAENAAIYANPFDVQSILDALDKAYKMSETERKEYITNGIHILEKYSWDKTSQMIHQVLINN